eukprot:2488511-Amphidinium_carterae.1
MLQLEDWLDACLSDKQAAYRKGRSTEQEAAKLSVLLESWSTEGPIFGAQVDLSKAFNYVDHTWLQDVLRRLQVDEGHWEKLKSIALRKSTRWKVFGAYVGKTEVPRRGIIQGCAMSCALFNLVVLPLVLALDAVDGLEVRSYADDLLICARTQGAVQEGLHLIGRFCAEVGFQVNPNKSTCWALGWKGGLPLHLQDHRLTRASSFNYLGVAFSCGDGVRMDGRLQARLTEYERRLDRLRHLPISRHLKMRLITTAITPVLVYGVWSYRFTQKLVQRWRTKLTNAIFDGSLNGPRCQEIVHTLFCPVHLVDLASAMFWYTLRVFTKYAAGMPQAWHLLRSDGRGSGLCDSMKAVEVTGDWWHNWRELMRRHLYQQAEQRRADMHGISGGINRQWLHEQYKGRSDAEAAVLRALHTGSVIVPERALRHKHGICLQGDEDLCKRRLPYKQPRPLSYSAAGACCPFCGNTSCGIARRRNYIAKECLRITDALLSAFLHWQQRYKELCWNTATSEAQSSSKHATLEVATTPLDADVCVSDCADPLRIEFPEESLERVVHVDVPQNMPNDERSVVSEETKAARLARVRAIASHFSITSERKICCDMCDAAGVWPQVLRFTSRHLRCVRPKFKEAKGRPRISLPKGFEYCMRRGNLHILCARCGSSSLATHEPRLHRARHRGALLGSKNP